MHDHKLLKIKYELLESQKTEHKQECLVHCDELAKTKALLIAKDTEIEGLSEAIKKQTAENAQLTAT